MAETSWNERESAYWGDYEMTDEEYLAYEALFLTDGDAPGWVWDGEPHASTSRWVGDGATVITAPASRVVKATTTVLRGAA